MKYFSIAILIFVFLLSSCSSVKKTEAAINQGDFDQAINIAIENIVDGKDSKRNQEYIPLLEDAYSKAMNQDQILIKKWHLDPNPSVLEPIYEAYLRMDSRQNKIRPLLPLKVIKEDRNANFVFEDYNRKIIESRANVSDYLLSNSATALANCNTLEARNIYNDLNYLDKINPNFKNTRELIQVALEKGTHFILLSVENKSQTVLPVRLEEELLNFSTYGINDQWKQYHNNKLNTVEYDYDVSIIFDRIIISPEQISQKELIREKKIKDGFLYEYDENGNVKKDSLGNDIKTDKYVTIKANVLQNTQLKESNVTATVQVKDNRNSQIVDRFPVKSSFVFSYLYGSIYGDKRALEANYLETLNPEAIAFPSDEQMVYDTGEDLKLKVKQILSSLDYN